MRTTTRKNKLTKILLPAAIIALIGLASSAHAVIVTGSHTYLLRSDEWDPSPASDTHTWTLPVAALGVSFDLVLTAVATGGNWNVAGGGYMGVGGGRFEPPEEGAFTLSIANFDPGTTGLSEDDVDFGITTHYLYLDARGSTDSGTFTLINGVAPSSTLTWIDSNGGSDFTGHIPSGFDLPTMNATYGDGSNVTSFTHVASDASWSFQNISAFYSFNVPEPSAVLLFCMGGGLLYAARKRSRHR